MKCLLFIALVIAPVGASGQLLQPPAAQQANPPPLFPADVKATGILRGRVYSADSGQPLRKAQVRIVSTDPQQNSRENRLASTDENGLYEFRELAAGRYTLTASKGSYVSLTYGQTRPFEAGRPIELLDAQVLERVDFSLPRGGVITGRIVDEYGEPLSNITISAVRAMPGGGPLGSMVTARSASTDDLGEFRLFGLSPSDYYVQATSRMPTPVSPPRTTAEDDRTGYATTFFPGVIESTDARKVTVGIAQIVEDVSFAMQTTRTARVSGTAVDSHGKPANGMLNVIRRTNGSMMGSGSSIRPDGSFTLSNMAPGEYTLQARTFGDDPEIASVTINVGAEDIADLHLITAPYLTATGRIVVDPALLQQMGGAVMSVTVFPADPAMFGGPIRPARVNDDLTFEVKAPPGHMRVRVVGLPAGLDIRAVRVGGFDVTDDGVEFKPGAAVRDIEVELTNRVATVSGLVTNARGEPARDYTAVLFSQDSNRWKPATRYIRTGRPDQDGRFKVTSLPPGDYYAVAIEALEAGRWNDPEYLQRVRTNATMFSLMEGETKTLDLRLQTAR